MKYETFPSGGYIIDDVPEELRPIILKSILLARQRNDSFNKRLAGHLKSQYNLQDLIANPKFDGYISELVSNLIQNWDTPYRISVESFSKNISLSLSQLWVNFQKKGEFNPVHTHSGVFTFVIWVQVPYLIENEEKLYVTSFDGKSQSGSFHFHTINCMGNQETVRLPVDKKWEWKIVVFPARLPHSVNPFFSSDGERISVSGNIQINNDPSAKITKVYEIDV